MRRPSEGEGLRLESEQQSIAELPLQFAKRRGSVRDQLGKRAARSFNEALLETVVRTPFLSLSESMVSGLWGSGYKSLERCRGRRSARWSSTGLDSVSGGWSLCKRQS